MQKEQELVMQTARKPKPEVHVHDVSKLKGQLKVIGGSMSDDWNNICAAASGRPR